MLGKLSVQIEDPVQTGAAFVATNNGVQYSVSRGANHDPGFDGGEQGADVGVLSA